MKRMTIGLFFSLSISTFLSEGAFSMNNVSTPGVVVTPNSVSWGVGYSMPVQEYKGFFNPVNSKNGHGKLIFSIGASERVAGNRSQFEIIPTSARRSSLIDVNNISRAIGFVPSLNFNKSQIYYPRRGNKAGEDFGIVDMLKGFGLYSRTGMTSDLKSNFRFLDFKDGPFYRLVVGNQEHANQTPGHTLAFSADIRKKNWLPFQPINGKMQKLILKVNNLRYSAMELTGIGAKASCRLMMAIRFQYVGPNPGSYPLQSIQLKLANSSQTPFDKKFGGMVTTAIQSDYNIFPYKKGWLKDKVTGTNIINNLGAVMLERPSRFGHNFAFMLEWSKFKKMLKSVVIKKQALGSTIDKKAKMFYGRGWNNSNNWKLKNIAFRSEQTQNKTNSVTECGGSFSSLQILKKTQY